MPSLPPHPSEPVPAWNGTLAPFLQERAQRGGRQHMGIDVFAPFGSDILAVADGTVVKASPTSHTQPGPNQRGVSWTREGGLGGFSGFGNVVVLKLSGTPANGGERYVLYAHLSKILVSSGQRVRAGEKIGEVGTTIGTRSDPTKIFSSSRAHLHMELSSTPYPKPLRTRITEPAAQSTLDPTPFLYPTNEAKTYPDPMNEQEARQNRARGLTGVTNRTVERRPQPPPPDEPPVERVEALTSGRTESPADAQFSYRIVRNAADTDVSDPHIPDENIIDISIANNIAIAPYRRWFNQMAALRTISNLDLTRTVPVLAIFAREGNDLINLNQIIFGQSPFVNIFDNQEEFSQTYPERPIASIEGFTLDVQSPTAGGGEASVSIANLSLQIHNPFLVNDQHPQGRFISYMMRMSYALRIRFGVEPPVSDFNNNNDELLEGLQWIEQDFYVTRHEISVNDDLSTNMRLTLMPGAEKLYNQIVIGSSFPATAVEVEEEIGSVTENPQVISDAQFVINRASNVEGSYVGVYAERRRDGTIGSVLHGATRNIDILSGNAGPDNIRARQENLINALRTVQSRFMTRRLESIFDDLGYQYTGRSTEVDLNYVAINCGPLLERMVKPELEQTVEFIGQNGLRMGPIYSTEAFRSDQNTSVGNEPIARTKVQMIFGNFNSRAGQWANKPISTFPVNMEKVLEYVRSERDVGKFFGSINNFINKINHIISNPSNYVIDQTSSDNFWERPRLRYYFYPNPEDSSAWIFYLYDSKEVPVAFGNALRNVAAEANSLTKEEVKSLLEQYNIPWIEPGLNSSLIRSMKASTQADDQIGSALMLQANSAYSARQIDGSRIPSGLSREFVHGLQLNLNDHIAQTTILLPLHLSIDYYIMVSAILFGHVYIFFPVPTFSGLYTINSLSHEVQNGMVSTKMDLYIQVTKANRQPASG